MYKLAVHREKLGEQPSRNARSEIALTILFYHKGDSSIARGIDEIQVRSSNGEISDFLINVISGQAVESFWLQNGEMISADLGKEVSRISGIHELKRIDIVSVCSGMLSDLEQTSFLTCLGQKCASFKAGCRCFNSG